MHKEEWLQSAVFSVDLKQKTQHNRGNPVLDNNTVVSAIPRACLLHCQ